MNGNTKDFMHRLKSLSNKESHHNCRGQVYSDGVELIHIARDQTKRTPNQHVLRSNHAILRNKRSRIASKLVLQALKNFNALRVLKYSSVVSTKIPLFFNHSNECNNLYQYRAEYCLLLLFGIINAD